MRQLSLQEVEVVSGAAKPILDFTVNDLVKWAGAYFGATTGFSTGTTLLGAHSLTVPYIGLDVAKWGVGGVTGGLGAVAGYAAGHFLGELFNSQVAARVG